MVVDLLYIVLLVMAMNCFPKLALKLSLQPMRTGVPSKRAVAAGGEQVRQSVADHGEAPFPKKEEPVW